MRLLARSFSKGSIYHHKLCMIALALAIVQGVACRGLLSRLANHVGLHRCREFLRQLKLSVSVTSCRSPLHSHHLTTSLFQSQSPCLQLCKPSSCSSRPVRYELPTEGATSSPKVYGTQTPQVQGQSNCSSLFRRSPSRPDLLMEVGGLKYRRGGIVVRWLVDKLEF
ncbi:hypothetical protein BKA63DRAFT_99664 [Paraphoma chrysanthemicola]|nr:hypothetical protein BKA63DRAFT_99664 [Paraphoma chrysanthemicola]